MDKAKSPARVASGKKGGEARAASLSAKERREISSIGGQIGGAARARALTKAKRKEIAKKAAAARWGKKG